MSLLNWISSNPDTAVGVGVFIIIAIVAIFVGIENAIAAWGRR